MPRKKIRFACKILLAIFIILIFLGLSAEIPGKDIILLILAVICCLILAILIPNLFRKKKMTVTLIRQERGDGKTWYGISINGNKPNDDEWFIAEGYVKIQDVIQDKSKFNYRLIIYNYDGQLSSVKSQRYELKS